ESLDNFVPGLEQGQVFPDGAAAGSADDFSGIVVVTQKGENALVTFEKFIVRFSGLLGHLQCTLRRGGDDQFGQTIRKIGIHLLQGPGDGEMTRPLSGYRAPGPTRY